MISKNQPPLEQQQEVVLEQDSVENENEPSAASHQVTDVSQAFVSSNENQATNLEGIVIVSEQYHINPQGTAVSEEQINTLEQYDSQNLKEHPTEIEEEANVPGKDVTEFEKKISPVKHIQENFEPSSLEQSISQATEEQPIEIEEKANVSKEDAKQFEAKITPIELALEKYESSKFERHVSQITEEQPIQIEEKASMYVEDTAEIEDKVTSIEHTFEESVPSTLERGVSQAMEEQTIEIEEKVNASVKDATEVEEKISCPKNLVQKAERSQETFKKDENNVIDHPEVEQEALELDIQEKILSAKNSLDKLEKGHETFEDNNDSVVNHQEVEQEALTVEQNVILSEKDHMETIEHIENPEQQITDNSEQNHASSEDRGIKDSGDLVDMQNEEGSVQNSDVVTHEQLFCKRITNALSRRDC